MSGWKLGLDGFVTHFMVSGPQEEPYFNEAKDKNQLRYEAYLRSVKLVRFLLEQRAA